MATELTQEDVLRIYDVDLDAGTFTFKRKPGTDMRTAMWNGRCAGKISGRSDSHGYTQVWVSTKTYLAHRLIWLVAYGEWPSGWLDHIDGDPQNNAVNNLRLGTASQNACNKKTRSDSKSGIKGVQFKDGLWIVRIQKDGKRMKVGQYLTAEMAKAAYGRAAKELHGEFARTA